MADEHDSNDAAGASGKRLRSGLRANIASAAAAVLVVGAGAVGVMWYADASTPSSTAIQQPTSSPATTTTATKSKHKSKAKHKQAPKPKPEPLTLAQLTESTTHTRLSDTPKDPAPNARNDGTVAHPKDMIPIYQRPGGKMIGKIGPKQMGDTWLPVIGKTKGWDQVLLPSKPNGSTGWIQSSQVDTASTPYLISVHLKSFKMQLFQDGKEINNWKISPGRAGTPTPTGRTFLLGSIVSPSQKYSPVILPLGTHSATLDSFGGGPGTVAIHTWPTEDVLGKALSQGCIRVSHKALKVLEQIPLGTLVLIDNQ